MSDIQFRFAGPVLGSPDPHRLAEFYHHLLGWQIRHTETAGVDGATDDWAMLVSPEGSAKVEIQFEPTFEPPVWPAQPGRQQMLQHLDFGVADLDEAVEVALGFGATLESHQPLPDVQVMRDPAGHIFCLFADPEMRSS